MNDGYQSNIRGSKGRPINPARRVPGFNSIRSQMDPSNSTYRDRVKARNLDHRRAKYQLQNGAGSGDGSTGYTPPVSGSQLHQRRTLFSEMEKAGPDGITPAMRERARGLGVSDEQFNTAAGKIRTNLQYTPATTGAAPAAPLPATTPPPSIAPQQATLRPSARGIQGPPAPGRIDGKRADEVLSQMRAANGQAAGATAEGGNELSDLAKQGMAIQKNAPGLIKLRDELARDMAPSNAFTKKDAASNPANLQPVQSPQPSPQPSPPVPAPAPAAPSSFEALTTPRAAPSPDVPAPSPAPVSAPAPASSPRPSVRKSEPVMTSPEESSERRRIRERDSAVRAAAKKAAQTANASRGVPEWAQAPNTRSPLKKALGRAIYHLQYRPE